jgi:hypothetical protein
MASNPILTSLGHCQFDASLDLPGSAQIASRDARPFGHGDDREDLDIPHRVSATWTPDTRRRVTRDAVAEQPADPAGI